MIRKTGLNRGSALFYTLRDLFMLIILQSRKKINAEMRVCIDKRRLLWYDDNKEQKERPVCTLTYAHNPVLSGRIFAPDVGAHARGDGA